MKHLGDITLIKGSEAPTVDCIIGGSPCQDLSLAGKRAGLAGARSGLYMEQIRIIKEMREADVLRGRADVDVRPRYMVWENVPGAFSTNGGKDFAAVLEEAIRVAEPEAPDVDVPEKGWPTSGCFFDEMGKWSVAWRVLDAQFWGTSDKPLPQRRRRIALVADFGGLSAPEILFVRKSVSGNLEPGKPKGKETAGDAGGGSGGTVCIEMTSTHNTIIEDGVCPTLTARMGTGGNQVNAVMEPIGINGDIAGTLDSSYFKGCGMRQGVERDVIAQPTQTYQNVTGPLMANSHPVSYTGQDAFSDMLVAGPVGTYQETGIGWWNESDVGATIRAMSGGDSMKANLVVYGVDCRNATEYPEMNATLQSDAAHNLNSNNVVRVKNIVRRLTPLECERLQGFPDGWTDIGEWVDSKGKKHKEADSPRYKALGNSIALPPWKWVLKRLCACYERDATMASLFDGIGGFPLIWEQLNGKGSCLLASEIEEFPMAVTKLRFGGDCHG